MRLRLLFFGEVCAHLRQGEERMKSGFWKTDWFLGLVVVVLMLFAGNSDLLQSLERKAYDMGVQASSRAASDKIAVIAIDDTSIANIGRWPWSREVHARMTALLKEAEQQLNTDRKLAESYGKANSVLLPMFFTLGEPRGKPDKPLPEFVQKNAI